MNNKNKNKTKQIYRDICLCLTHNSPRSAVQIGRWPCPTQPGSGTRFLPSCFSAITQAVLSSAWPQLGCRFISILDHRNGERKTWRSHTHFLKKIARSSTNQFHTSCIAKNLVKWPHLSAGSAGKCNVLGIHVLGYNCFSKGFHKQLAVSTTACK